MIPRILLLAVITALPALVLGSVNYTCLPTQNCWPTSSEWQTFNRSIGGKLRVTHPRAEPCYDDVSSTACKDVATGYLASKSRASQYGAMEYLNFEVCGSDQCLLNSLDPLTGIHGTCSLGRLSAYYVEAHYADDVSKTLAFVQQHQIRLSIKNTGHDSFGRSVTANSLALWTYNMKDLGYHKAFTPSGCKTHYQDIGEIGAGISAEEAYTFFETLGFHVTIGAIGSVGIAGGFGQGGGHGPLGPSYGLMVDQAVEFEVITADGQLRLINECNDPDLFWAMRGGGGGTYAVLTRYKFQLHPAVPINVYSFEAGIFGASLIHDFTKSMVHRQVVTALAKNQTTWSNNHVAGYNFIYPDRIISLQILPSNDTEILKSLTADWNNFLSSHPGLRSAQKAYLTFDKFSDYIAFTRRPSIANNGIVGVGLAEAGRLMPRELFSTEAGIENLVDAFLQGMQISSTLGTGLGSGTGQIYATGPSNHIDNTKTGVNPAWRGSLWEIVFGGVWLKTDAQEKRDSIQHAAGEAIKPMKDLTPSLVTTMLSCWR